MIYFDKTFNTQSICIDMNAVSELYLLSPEVTINPFKLPNNIFGYDAIILLLE